MSDLTHPNALRLQNLGQSASALVFQLYAEAVVAATYYRAADKSVAVSLLALPVPTAKVDGITIKPGDELLLILATDLMGIDQPRAGDYVVETVGNLRRNIIVSQLDLSRTLWSLVGRKTFASPES